jgi:hypothetical protein
MRKYLLIGAPLVFLCALFVVLANHRVVFTFRDLTVQKMGSVESLCLCLDYLNIPYKYEIDDIYRAASTNGLTEYPLQYLKYDAWGNEMKIVEITNACEKTKVLFIVSVGGSIEDFCARKAAICRPIKMVAREPR